MSKFFSNVRTSDDSESSEEEQQVVVSKNVQSSRTFQLVDDDDNVKRIVKSQRDKRFDELHICIKKIRNMQKIKNVSQVADEFENLTKIYIKSKAVVDKEGVPKFYVKVIAGIEDFVNKLWDDKDARQKFSKINAKALSTLRHKIKKYNKMFESEINDYHTNPKDYESEKSDDDEDGDEKDEDDFDEDDVSEEDTGTPLPVRPSQTAPTLQTTSRFASKFLDSDQEDDMDEDDKQGGISDDDEEDDDDSEDDEEDDDDDDDDDSSSDAPVYAPGDPSPFLKSTFLKDKDKDTKLSGKREAKPKGTKPKRKTEEEREKDEGEWTEVKVTKAKKSLFAKDQEINHQTVIAKMQEILSVRGRKGTDRKEQIKMLLELKSISEGASLGPAISIKVLDAVIAIHLESSPSVDLPMKVDDWKNTLVAVAQLFSILEADSTILFSDTISDEEENLKDLTQPYKIQGCALTLLLRVDDEFTKILKASDCHSQEYLDRLKDEYVLVNLIERLEKYYERTGNEKQLSHIYMLHIEHLYYKPDMGELHTIKDLIRQSLQQFSGAAENEPTVLTSQDQETNTALMARLCHLVASKGVARMRTRSVLCYVYYLAITNNWYKARDTILMWHIQDNIQQADDSTKILYNRTLAQLGLCAFRNGLIADAYNCLCELQKGVRTRESLGQGLIPRNEKGPEQEKLERRMLVPFHMHINLELLECAFLTSAMLLKVPYMNVMKFDPRRRDDNFLKIFEKSEGESYIGPPETTRDHVLAAAKAMKNGDLKKCRDYLLNIKCWSLFPKAEAVKVMLARKIQEESLKTYILTYARYYETISLSQLVEMFELPESSIHAIVSKMIVNDDCQASWDEPAKMLVIHHGAETTPLQNLALQLAESITILCDRNQHLTDTRISQPQGGRDKHARHRTQRV